VLAGTIDRYVIKPAVALLPLPRRWAVQALQCVVLVLSALLLFGGRITTNSSRRCLAAVLCIGSPVLFLLATPFTRPGMHALCAALNLAILASFAADIVASPHTFAGRRAVEHTIAVVLAVASEFLVAEAIAARLWDTRSSRDFGLPDSGVWRTRKAIGMRIVMRNRVGLPARIAAGCGGQPVGCC
jgi:hypothetical protein